jgi:hypothetical protein
MDSLTPSNFHELLTGILMLIGVTFSFFSLNEKLKKHSLRIAGLSFISGITIFSNNAWCYFASIFIVATTVTQLEFLQNLAAIIRGSKEYFEYQKEFLSQNEIAESVAKEAEEAKEIQEEDQSQELQDDQKASLAFKPPKISFEQFWMLCEQNAFRYFESRHGKPIERHVRFRKHDTYFDFDGIMELESHDVIFEIKVSRNDYYPVSTLKTTLRRLVQMVKGYTKITKRPASLALVLIGDLSYESKIKIEKSMSQAISQLPDINISIELLKPKQIGLEEVVDSKDPL